MVCCVISLMVVLAMVANPTHGDAPPPSPSPSPASSRKVTELVDKVCNKTSNYKNCVDTLYSDPQTQEADRYTLAYVSFGLAFHNAVQTRDRIAQLLNNNHSDRLNLQICLRDYKKAVKLLESALNDLNSETFFTLPGYANDTARVADDCQAHYPPITSATLKSIGEICTVIAKLFTGGVGAGIL